MEAFVHLFASQFADAQRTLTNTLAGFVDHAIRLAGHPSAKAPWTALLAAAQTDTQALRLRAEAAQQALGLRLGTQKQATGSTATAQATALARIRKNEGTLRGDALIEDEKERQRVYQLLYPSGLQYYTDARLGTQLTDRLGEYLTRTEAEKAALGDAFVQRVQADLGSFRATRQTQVENLGDTGDARADRHELLDALNEQCDYNYHLLSALHRTELHRPATYWNPAYYLRPGSPEVATPTTPTPKPTPKP